MVFDPANEPAVEPVIDPLLEPVPVLFTTAEPTSELEPELPVLLTLSPSDSVDPEAVRLGRTTYEDGTRYGVEGPLAPLVQKGQEYLDSVTGGAGTTLTAVGMATDARLDRFILDSSWRLVQQLPAPFPGAPPLTVEGDLKIRISALGKPQLAKKGAAGVAKNYKKIREYAIGLSFDSTNDGFDSDLIISYRNPGKSSYQLSRLSRQSIQDLLNVSKVTAVAASGPLAPTLAGAIDLQNTPLFQADSSPFSPELAPGWPTNGWVAS